MKIIKDRPSKDSSLTQTLPRDISEKIKQNSDERLSEENINKKTKTYEPKPLSPQDPLYDQVMEQIGARPVKPKYWFEEFGEFWSCSCGHINKGDTCVGCGLERSLLRSLFILHKPADATTGLANKINENINKIEKQSAYQKEASDRRKANTSTDLKNIKPIEPAVDSNNTSEENNSSSAGSNNISGNASGNSSGIASSNSTGHSSGQANGQGNNASGLAEPPVLYTELSDNELGTPKKLLPALANISKKKKIIAGIVAALIIALGAGGYFIYEYIASPAIEYDNAVDLMKAGKYDQAIELFKTLGDYEDCQALIKECENAIAYNEAAALFKDGKFTDAASAFEALGDYSDSREQIQKCYEALGDKKYSEHKYTEAIQAYETAQDIKNSNSIQDKINDTKFAYVKARIALGGNSLEAFLHDLKEINYPGIDEYYNKFYAWKAKVIANDEEDNYSSDKSSLDIDDDIYFHISISGGEPNEKLKLYYVLTWPSGRKDTQQLDNQWKSGSRITAHFSYPIKRFGKSGNMTLTVYDSESNDKLGSKTIALKKD